MSRSTSAIGGIAPASPDRPPRRENRRGGDRDPSGRHDEPEDARPMAKPPTLEQPRLVSAGLLFLTSEIASAASENPPARPGHGSRRRGRLAG